MTEKIKDNENMYVSRDEIKEHNPYQDSLVRDLCDAIREERERIDRHFWELYIEREKKKGEYLPSEIKKLNNEIKEKEEKILQLITLVEDAYCEGYRAGERSGGGYTLLESMQDAYDSSGSFVILKGICG